MKSWLQKKWNNGKMLAELKPAFFLSLTFCFMIFIYAPLELYINNVDEFWYDVYLLFPFIIKDFFLFLLFSIVGFLVVAIILCGYLMNWGYSLIVSLVCLGLHFTLGLATFYGPLSVIFDYLLPMVLIGLTPLIPLLKVGKYELPVGIIVMGGLKTICHLISGWYAFQTPLQANLTYNLPYNIATIIACFILFVILYPRLKKAVHL